MFLVGRVVGMANQAVEGGETAWLGWLVAGLAATFVVNSVLPVLQQAASVAMEIRIDGDVAKRVADPMLTPRGVAHLEDPTVQDVYARTRDEAQWRIGSGASVAVSLVAGRVGLLGAAGLIGILFSWWMPIVLLASVRYAEWYVARRVNREIGVYQGQVEGQRKASYLFDLGMLDGAKEIRIFGLSQWMVDRHARLWHDALAPVWRQRWRGVWVSIAVLGVHVATHAAAVILAIRAAYRGDISLAHATAVLPSILLIGAGTDADGVSRVRRATATLQAMVELPEVIATRHPARTGCQVDLSGAPCREIRFEGVCFRYPDQKRDVLHGLDLTIAAGDAVGLVGVNGAGKSTFVKLLAGGYQPTSGRVTVDGVDLATLGPASLAIWQCRIATIVQDFLQLPLSAQDNIALGAYGSRRDDEAFSRAADRAGIKDLVDRLPNGGATILARAFDGGTDLSGGEWQRIALARALYAVELGAGVLVLDEPAAALDARAEATLVSRYLELTTGVTSLIISHRFSVVRDADRICVLDNGRIVEDGTHDQLLATGGRYATMFQLQADRYAPAKAAGDA